MEANLARFFNYKQVQWEYEREVFTFPYGASRLGITRYKPDFKVVWGKTSHYIEVKGFMDIQDAEKIRLFKKYYPWLKLSFFFPEQYEYVRHCYARYIPHWEGNTAPNKELNNNERFVFFTNNPIMN